MPSLLVHPTDPEWVPADPEALIEMLREIGLLGADKAVGKVREFWSGGQFLKLIMFLGCSPAVNLDPDEAPDGQAACFIRLPISNTVDFLSAGSRSAARCTYCKATAVLSGPVVHDIRRHCDQCGRESVLSGLDWRQAAGFGRCFIECQGIYPHEAVPSDRLIEKLSEYSCCGWTYFYV